MNGVKADFLSQEKLKKVETEGLLTKTPSEVTETSFKDRKTSAFVRFQRFHYVGVCLR